ncbi:MAG: glycoside hydrolase family 3 C-terminal domain-containing protein [Clostridia bacterium]
METDHVKYEYIIKAEEAVSKMTLEEKCSLCSGLDFWHTKPVKRLDIPSVMVTDGPHGLRKQIDEGDHLGINESVPATCFPPAVTTSCSFDRDLLYEMGQALADECLEEDVSTILGPAVNIKRSPLCGRNFEYISEDPYLAGETAAALIRGIQSRHVGTSLKHYCTNNQEKMRMVSDSVVDERALREIYLVPFEKAVKEAQPWTVMCSYNRINGTYASDNGKLMTDILRNEWGYKGLVMTDWGALSDRVEAIKAGVDLEMPYSGGDTDKQIVKAVKDGRLDEKLVDLCATRVTAFALYGAENKKAAYDKNAHHELARRIARESAVLLKNDDNVLPANKKQKIAIIGEFAKTPRYQGAGSSKIVPSMMNSVFDEFTSKAIDFTYAKGYDIVSDLPNEDNIKEAVQHAKKADIVFVFVGLPDSYESEGYDRNHIDLPPSHNMLIDELVKANSNTVAIVFTGSAIAMPWISKVKGVLLMNLTGQNGGGAAYDLLFGDYSPCGKLTETYPLSITETPSYNWFGKGKEVEYRESIYVGYRYYDKANRKVAFPFGYGLSYSRFSYTDLKLSAEKIKDTDTLDVTLKVKNIGKMSAKEIVQVYVRPPVSDIFKPVRELKGYAKVSLQPGEFKEVSFMLDSRAFAYYNVDISDWHVPTGKYTVEIGASSRDICLQEEVEVISTKDAPVPDYTESAPAYYTMTAEVLDIPKKQFEAILGHAVPDSPPNRPYTINSTINDIQTSFTGRLLTWLMMKKVRHMTDVAKNDENLELMIREMLYDMPLRSLCLMTGGMFTMIQVEGLVTMMNGRFFKGLGMVTAKKAK